MSLPEAALVLVAAGAGALAVGPLLSHAIVRWMGWRVVLPILFAYVPARKEIGSSRMVCRRCGEPVPSWARALPLMPWMAVGGRCRRCGEQMAARAAGVELVTALAFGLAAWRIGWSPQLLPVLVLAAGLVAASAVDLACWRIPTRFVWITVGGAVPAIAVAAMLDGEPRSMLGAVVGAMTYFALLAPLHALSPRLLGLGDVRLGFLAGLVVGWMAWSADFPVYGPMSGVLQALLVSSVVGMAVGIRLLLARRRGEPYPFGPWLSLGAFVVILVIA